MYTLPDVGFSSPASWFSSVDFAAARLADDTAELALFYRQIDIIQRNDALLADGIDLAQLLCTDDWCQTHTSLRAIYHILYHISTIVGR